MSADSAYRVETTPHLAQWRIETLSSTYRKSNPFRIGLWNWFLTVERSKQFCVKLYPEVSSLTRDQPPIASFVIKLVSSSSSSDRKTIVHPGICDKQLKNSDDFVWAVDTPFTGKLIIDVEFLDLKVAPSSGGEPASIWTGYPITKQSSFTALTALSRMLIDSIHTDITITTSDGSIGAHRAVLATRSPVFHSMFSHNLKEKELSMINISDMGIEACQAFLNYIYGNFQATEFMTHRLDLLRAADKYDIADLKEACHESLVEDIDAKNVLERLQVSHLYRLNKLKASCMRYLVNFGKVYEIRDELNLFIQNADRELIAEIFQEILSTWKGY
ncbi:BTB/POZ domain-containing protein [Rhynchospora pubera]|uniref:BTB/POZ domain-containing protein n=1 Tax=Rhynchospora pubera TaxID=906938 RepID=A0AAV8BYL3_9POAL|nr:BTB/POZ domain-containing protein [Rhynchospora pubera]